MTSLLVVYCMGMSTAYKDIATPVTDDESIAVIHQVLQLGVTFLDTSDVYGPFTNEELVGEVVLLISVIELLLRCE
jgi:aryl-alcohol dehydrogenase-like predicted oxidoreductase